MNTNTKWSKYMETCMFICFLVTFGEYYFKVAGYRLNCAYTVISNLAKICITDNTIQL